MAWLPSDLPEALPVKWEVQTPTDSLGGIAADQGFVVAGGRDPLDSSDLFVCWDALTGTERWRYRYPAIPPAGFTSARDGKLDFGNSPRATPAIVGDCVVTLGAFGDVACLDLATGSARWKLNLLLDYGGELPTWGFVGSPLVRAGVVYLQTAAADAALVAIRLADGEELWTAAGAPTAYSSLIETQVGGESVLLGWDQAGAAGWSLADKKRTWSFPPPEAGEFLVPSPLVSGEQVLLVGEVNGARLHRFGSAGTLDPQPGATFAKLKPDSHTPVRVGPAIVGVQGRLWSLSAETLQALGSDADPELGEYGALISNGSDTTLLLTLAGDLFLHHYTAGVPQQIAHRRLAAESISVYAHPALWDRYLYCRLGTRLVCYTLAP